MRINMKKLGVAAAGALLLGSTLMGAVGAATEVDNDFFINPDDGEPMCLVVVGSNAAAEDVVSASWISAQIGSMAYYTEYQENEQLYTLTYLEEEEVDNYLLGSSMFAGDDYFDDFRAHAFPNFNDPESWVVLPYTCEDDESGPIWDFDVYVDHNTAYTCDAEIWVDTGCSYESVTVDFSVRDLECTSDLCISCSAGCDQMGIFEYTDDDVAGVIDNGDLVSYDEMLEAIAADEGIVVGDFEMVENLAECQTYPNVYPRQYWGSPSWSSEPCDPIGGMEYRTTVYGLDDIEPEHWWAIIGPDSEAYNVCEPIAPVEISLYCDACEVYFLGETYDVLNFGTNDEGVDYMFYGTPKWYIEEKLKVGESKDYGGYTLTINDLGIYENKIFSTITTPSGSTHDYVSVIDTYTSQVPSDGEGDSDNWENQTIAFEEETCSSDEVVFAVKFVKTMIGASGNYVVEYHAYNLLDYGCLTERIYPGPCDTVSDELYMPYVVSNCGGSELEWYLDIIPNDDIQMVSGVQVDLDNERDLFLEGNPNYDMSDKLTIFADDVVVQSLVGTGLMFETEAAAADALDDYFYTEADFNPSVVSNFFVDALGDSSDLMVPECHPMLELWLATPVELAGMCSDALTVCLDDLEGNNYLTLEVEDTIHTDYRIDGSVEVIKKEELAPTPVVHYVSIDVTKLVTLDSEIESDPELKGDYNLVLIGGPVANVIVQELVDLGFTTYEEWDTSAGDYKLYEDVYALGKDVLIVAGADRTATAKAALDLIAEM